MNKSLKRTVLVFQLVSSKPEEPPPAALGQGRSGQRGDEARKGTTVTSHRVAIQKLAVNHLSHLKVHPESMECCSVPNPAGQSALAVDCGRGGAERRLRKFPRARIHLSPLLPAGSCLLPLCLDTASTKICAAWPLSAHTKMLVDFYIAPRHRGGSRWDSRNTECYIAWYSETGLANRWSLWEWTLGLPGNRFF